jgi:hypothetical protein
MRAALASLALLVPACSSPVETGTPITPTPAAWQHVGTLALDAEGGSPPLHLDVPPGARSVVVRATAADGAAVMLDSVVTDDGATWVDDARATHDDGLSCRHCSVELTAGDGYGLFALPTTSGLTLRVGLRDARFGGFLADPALVSTPVRVDVAFPEVPAPGAKASLSVGVVRARSVSAEGLTAALVETTRLFAAAGIDLVATPVADLGVEAPAVVRVEVGAPDDTTALSAAAESALGATLARVPVVLVDAIEQSDAVHGRVATLAALSTRVGGVPAPGARGAVFVAVDTARTTPRPPGVDRARWLGTILAHEIGHWLGLRHDQDRTVRVAVPTLMTAQVAASPPGQLAFAADQALTLIRHPLVSFVRRNP